MCDTCWSDQKVKPGQKWRDELEAALVSARLGVLMVTPSFLASEFIQQNDLPTLVARAEAGTLTLVPIPVRAVDWEGKVFSRYQSMLELRGPYAFPATTT